MVCAAITRFTGHTVTRLARSNEDHFRVVVASDLSAGLRMGRVGLQSRMVRAWDIEGLV